ncbi:MAG: adenine phosphoribosyltransferase [Vicingaceae bacterium]
MIEEQVKQTIRDVPDFPKEGIVFKDITPILQKPELCKSIIDEFEKNIKNWEVDVIIGIESRGFLFGPELAMRINVPFVPVRKKGKLPYKTVSIKYGLEYGEAEIEMHIDAIKEGSRVLIHDDLLATGGTAEAAAKLVKQQNAEITGYLFLVDLTFLKGTDLLKKYTDNIYSLVKY